jgi:hypothetical protein
VKNEVGKVGYFVFVSRASKGIADSKGAIGGEKREVKWWESRSFSALGHGGRAWIGNHWQGKPCAWRVLEDRR